MFSSAKCGELGFMLFLDERARIILQDPTYKERRFRPKIKRLTILVGLGLRDVGVIADADLC